MRSIIAGIVPSAPAKIPSRSDDLLNFEASAVQRWSARVDKLPAGAAPRFPHGYFDVGIAIDGDFDVPTLGQLRETIRTAVRNHSGWPSFLTLDRVSFTPKPIDGAVEFWRGPDNGGSFGAADHSDFWRISPQGFFFTRRGYREDGADWGLEPGKFFDITNPTWRVGDAIAQAAYIANALKAANGNLICHCRWTALAGRQLISVGRPTRLLSREYVAAQDTYEAAKTFALDAFPTALPELMFAILAPLYELFDFFSLAEASGRGRTGLPVAEPPLRLPHECPGGLTPVRSVVKRPLWRARFERQGGKICRATELGDLRRLELRRVELTAPHEFPVRARSLVVDEANSATSAHFPDS
jgi:hypothetical protein